MKRLLRAHRVMFEPRRTWGAGPAVPILEFLTHPSGGSIDAINLTAFEGRKSSNARGIFRIQVVQLIDGELQVVSVDEEIRSIDEQKTVEILGFKVIEPDLPLFVRLVPLFNKSTYTSGSKLFVTVYMLEDEAI